MVELDSLLGDSTAKTLLQAWLKRPYDVMIPIALSDRCLEIGLSDQSQRIQNWAAYLRHGGDLPVARRRKARLVRDARSLIRSIFGDMRITNGEGRTLPSGN